MESGPTSSFSDRLSVVNSLTGSRIVAMITNVILALGVLAVITLFDSPAMILLGYIVAFVVFWVGVLVAFIYAISRSKYYAIRISLVDAIKTTLQLEFQLLIIWMGVISGTALIFRPVGDVFTSFVVGLVFIAIMLVFPLLSFYLVFIWILDNMDNKALRGVPNPDYRYGMRVATPMPYQSSPIYPTPHKTPTDQHKAHINQQKNRIICENCGNIQQDNVVDYCENCGGSIRTS